MRELETSYARLINADHELHQALADRNDAHDALPIALQQFNEAGAALLSQDFSVQASQVKEGQLIVQQVVHFLQANACLSTQSPLSAQHQFAVTLQLQQRFTESPRQITLAMNQTQTIAERLVTIQSKVSKQLPATNNPLCEHLLSQMTARCPVLLEPVLCHWMAKKSALELPPIQLISSLQTTPSQWPQAPADKKALISLMSFYDLDPNKSLSEIQLTLNEVPSLYTQLKDFASHYEDWSHLLAQLHARLYCNKVLPPCKNRRSMHLKR